MHALHTLHMPCPAQPMVRKVPGRTTPPHPRSRNRAVLPGPALRHAHCELHLLTAAARQEAEAHRRVERVVKAAAERRGMRRLQGIWRDRQHQQADPEPAPCPGRPHVRTSKRPGTVRSLFEEAGHTLERVRVGSSAPLPLVCCVEGAGAPSRRGQPPGRFNWQASRGRGAAGCPSRGRLWCSHSC